tara:strand:+ start:69 stop:998 length:930 start_codon:yes stop_codon:yes gene_type:complete
MKTKQTNLNTIKNVNNKKNETTAVVRKKYKKKKIFCLNCGKYGHQYNYCNAPITSTGIILYRNRNYNNGKTEKEFLHICRKDTIGYIDFIRGKYRLSDISYIQKLINMMTQEEKDKITKLPFSKLWRDIWCIPSNLVVNCHKREYKKSETRYVLLRNGYTLKYTNTHICLSELIGNSINSYKSAEWGFPKGRRLFAERDIDCARREFTEETAIPSQDYTIHTHIRPIVSNFIGQNSKKYKHIFFVAEYKGDVDSFKISDDNMIQKSEVSDIKWFTIHEANNIFRPYNRNKIVNLYKAMRFIPDSFKKKI